MADEIEIRECTTVAEFDECIRLQKEAFGLPDLEVSPRRHLIVSRQAGGWTLGAFEKEKIVGFVHHLAAVRGAEIFGYSHMMAVAIDQQNKGLGAKLKWAQRERALSEGRSFIKWTWEPLRARNAHFNLNRLGVVVEGYSENFYGTDYGSDKTREGRALGFESDRLFASWYLQSESVKRLAAGSEAEAPGEPAATIAIPANWQQLAQDDPERARQEQLRVRSEFQQALAAGLVCRAFARDNIAPRYLLFNRVD